MQRCKFLAPTPIRVIWRFLAPTPFWVIWGFLAPTPVVVNEVLYDPVGSDRGSEFVEIMNTTHEEICLDGWRLETGNGAYEDRWRTEWEGSPSDTLAPGGFFVIGEANVVPPPDVICDLDLQNGPDACRIVGPDGQMDVIGWGDHEFACYFEGEPATCAPSGSSLARDPDGVDTDCNGDDFVVLRCPTPARYNHPPLDLFLKKACLSRYSSPTSANLDLVCLISNTGLRPFGGGSRIVASGEAFVVSSFVETDIEPGCDMHFVNRFPNPGSGLHLVTVWIENADDLNHHNDSLTTTFVVEPPPLVINEILFCPSGKDCEWIELYCRDEVDLTFWTLEDSHGKPIAISRDHLQLARGDYLVLVEDEEIFKTKHPDVATNKILRPAGGWLSLNDTNNALEFADRVIIRDTFGTAIDSIAYAQEWTECGCSIERIDPDSHSTLASNWSPHYGQGTGSPGEPNSVSIFSFERLGFLKLNPRVISPNGDGKDDVLAIRIDLPQLCDVELRVYDLRGIHVATLLRDASIEAGRTTFWDGRDSDGNAVRSGVYLVVLRAKGRRDGKAYGAKLPVVVIRR